MKERIRKQTGAEGDRITACTFHSFCCRFLRRYIPYAWKTNIIGALYGEDRDAGPSLYPGNNFRIISSAEQMDILGYMREEYRAEQNELACADADAGIPGTAGRSFVPLKFA